MGFIWVHDSMLMDQRDITYLLYIFVLRKKVSNLYTNMVVHLQPIYENYILSCLACGIYPFFFWWRKLIHILNLIEKKTQKEQVIPISHFSLSICYFFMTQTSFQWILCRFVMFEEYLSIVELCNLD